MHCIQNNETHCNIRHLIYSPPSVLSSVHLFCAGTALALCAIALLSGACAIIPMASCTSVCQTYCTPLPSHNYHYPVKNEWCGCVLKKKIYRFCMDLTCTQTLRFFSPSGGSSPGLSCGCGYPSLYFYPKTWYLLLTPQQFHCCCVNKITKKTLTLPQPGNPANKTQDILHQFLDIRL